MNGEKCGFGRNRRGLFESIPVLAWIETEETENVSSSTEI
jgi:hypothetical protein